VQQPLEVMARDLADLRQTVNQLEVMGRDLADLRQTVNRLAVGQQQMTRDIASLQAGEKDIRHRISAPTPKPAAASASKPPPQGGPRTLAAPPPPALPPTPLQPAPEIATVPLGAN
jgi:hypothetical protein